MALDKEEQAFLYERCREAFGDRGAKLLMTELPPTGWEDIATKKDLEILEHKLLAAFRGELTAAITSQTRSITFQLATMFVGFAGLTLAFR